MKALIGLSIKQAKETAKQELGVKRMGDARFQMILDEGVRKGDFIIDGDMIRDGSVDSFFDFEVMETEVEIEPKIDVPPIIDSKTPHPSEANLDPKLSSSDLPRAGDMYYYRSYTGDVVQGEVVSVVCFAECQNPDGTWQSVAFQDLHIRGKGIPKETLLNSLRAYYKNNDHLRAEKNQLLKEIEKLQTKIAELKEKP
jgi:hypothetical protein